MSNRYYCFFTHHYRDWSAKCIASFAQFGLTVEPVEMPDSKDWMSHCMWRCSKLIEFAEQYPQDGVGILDADLTCLKDPLLLKSFGVPCPYPIMGQTVHEWVCRFPGGNDVAVHDNTDVGYSSDDKCSRYSAGVICFAPTLGGRQCLKDWSQLCKEDKLKGQERLREQVYLYECLQKCKVFNLGKFYNRVIDSYTEGDETVILHHVASRQLRNVVGNKQYGMFAV